MQFKTRVYLSTKLSLSVQAINNGVNLIITGFQYLIWDTCFVVVRKVLNFVPQLTFASALLLPMSLAQHQARCQNLIVVFERRVQRRVVFRRERGGRKNRPLRRDAFHCLRPALEEGERLLRRLRHLLNVLGIERAPRRRRRRLAAPAQALQLAEHCIKTTSYAEPPQYRDQVGKCKYAPVNVIALDRCTHNAIFIFHPREKRVMQSHTFLALTDNGHHEGVDVRCCDHGYPVQMVDEAVGVGDEVLRPHLDVHADHGLTQDFLRTARRQRSGQKYKNLLTYKRCVKVALLREMKRGFRYFSFFFLCFVYGFCFANVATTKKLRVLS
mgnify:FL=1